MKIITDKTIIENTGVTVESLLSCKVDEITTPAGKFSVSCWKSNDVKREYIRGKFVDKFIVTVQVVEPIDKQYPGIDYTIVGDKITEMMVW